MSTPTQPRTIDPERLAQITYLAAGNHKQLTPGGGCLLEMTSWLAGEPWSDHPQCVCPTLATYGRALNDAMDDVTRQRLLPYVPRLLDTRGSLTLMLRRAFVAADYAVRVFAPLALDADGLTAEATRLRGHAPVTSRAVANSAGDAAYSAGAAADHAGAAAYSAGAAADHAGDAADHACDAADHACDAADHAADAADHAADAAYSARDAAYSARAAAVWDAALACFDAMLAVTEEAA